MAVSPSVTRDRRALRRWIDAARLREAEQFDGIEQFVILCDTHARGVLRRRELGWPPAGTLLLHRQGHLDMEMCGRRFGPATRFDVGVEAELRLRFPFVFLQFDGAGK